MASDGDTGLFGPGSVTWRLHQEPILTLGGLRSLYLQALHPRAVAGVAQNSAYKSDPWGRFVRTSEFVQTVIWGSTAEVEQAGQRLRRVHARMTAVDPATGDEFRIDEPGLLRWVHVTEVESFLSTARRAGFELSDADADRYYREQRRAAEVVGLDPAAVPGSVAEVADYYDSMRPELALTRDGAETALFLTAPPVPADWGSRPVRLGLTLGPTRWAYFGIAGTALALLPPWARKMYGGLGLPAVDSTANLTARGMRLLLASLMRVVPEDYRMPPMRKAALARAGLTG